MVCTYLHTWPLSIYLVSSFEGSQFQPRICPRLLLQLLQEHQNQSPCSSETKVSPPHWSLPLAEFLCLLLPFLCGLCWFPVFFWFLELAVSLPPIFYQFLLLKEYLFYFIYYFCVLGAEGFSGFAVCQIAGTRSL